MLGELRYSKDDERRDQPNPSKLDIDGSLYSSLSSLSSALNIYSRFREATSDAWGRYLKRAKQILDDGSLDDKERYKKDELGVAISSARSAVLANSENWSQLVKNAISHPKNNLIHWQGNKKARLAGWVDQSPDEVRAAAARTVGRGTTKLSVDALTHSMRCCRATYLARGPADAWMRFRTY